MELHTHVVDRVLAALSPSLGAELDRILQEAQEKLEVEFQDRLQSAVLEATAAAQRTADARLEQTVSEARHVERRLVSDELQAQFSRTLQETTDNLAASSSARFQKASADWAATRAQLEEQLEEWRLFADAQRQLAGAESQPEMLARFLKLTERFAASLGLYTAKSDGLALWKSRGGAVFPPIVSPETIDPEFYFRQIVIRDKVVAALCAAQPCRPEPLNFLAVCLEQAIALFGMKLRGALPDPKPKSEISTPAISKTSTTEGARMSGPSLTPASVLPAAPAPSADERLHADARHMARLLVSEIKLRHEQEVRDGRANSDLYRRLRNQIEGSRDQYRQRVSAAVLAGPDYFYEELVRILAAREPGRLGADNPGPMTS